MTSVVARVVLRLRTWRRLFLDDYFLFLGASFLIATTGMLYTIYTTLYIDTAILADLTVAFAISATQLQDVVNNAASYTITVIVLCWCATFSVKLSFLAFFKQLINGVPKMRVYYWFMVVFVVVTWAFLVGEAFILCPYFGSASAKCFSHDRDLLYISLTGLVTALDGITDLMSK
jgi:hypothetical protein